MPRCGPYGLAVNAVLSSFKSLGTCWNLSSIPRLLRASKVTDAFRRTTFHQITRAGGRTDGPTSWNTHICIPCCKGLVWFTPEDTNVPRKYLFASGIRKTPIKMDGPPSQASKLIRTIFPLLPDYYKRDVCAGTSRSPRVSILS